MDSELVGVLMIAALLMYAYLLWDNAVMTFKIGFLKESFRLNKEKFSPEYYKRIEKIINSKKPWI